MANDSEIAVLRDAYHAALEEFDAATAIIATHLVKRSRPSPPQMRREERARRALEKIRGFYFAAWRKSDDATGRA